MNENTPADSIAAVDAALTVLPGFEVVQIPETPKAHPDLETMCHTMNAAEVDCQNALHEIVAILGNLKKSVNDLDNALSLMGC